MSMSRDRRGYISFECDECGNTTETEEKSFGAAIQVARDQNIISRLIDEVWHHFCNRLCRDAFAEKAK